MQVDLAYLRRHYASLSDDALLAVNETELVDEARRIYDEEIAQRKLAPVAKRGSGDAGFVAPQIDGPNEVDADLDGDPEPDWLGDAAVGQSRDRPGLRSRPPATRGRISRRRCSSSSAWAGGGQGQAGRGGDRPHQQGPD